MFELQKAKVVDVFNNFRAHIGRECKFTDLEKLIIKSDINIDRVDFDYLVMYLFTQSRDVEKLRFWDTFTYLGITVPNFE